MKTLVLLFLLFVLSPFVSAEQRFSAQIQASYAPPSGSVIGGMLEAQLNALPAAMSITAAYSYMEYYFEDGDYWEEGWGNLYGIGARYYTGGKAMQQWYVGAELTQFDITVDWGGYQYYGATWGEGIVPVLSAGYQKQFDKFFIEPNAMMALIGVVDSEAEVPVILTVGLGAGMYF